MGKKYNTAYTKDEVIEIMNAYRGIVYAQITLDSLNLDDNSKENAAMLRNILENTLPAYRKAITGRLAKEIKYPNTISIRVKCEDLLSQLEKKVSQK